MDNTNRSCEFCGAPLSASARFCENCGQPAPGAASAPPSVGTPAWVDAAPPEPAAPPAPPVRPAAPPAPATVYSPPPPIPPAAPKSGCSRWLIAGLVLVAVCICCSTLAAIGVVIINASRRSVMNLDLDTIINEIPTGIAPDELPTVPPLPTLPPLPAQTVVAPAKPSPVPPTTAGKVANFENISFSYDQLAEDASYAVVAAQNGADTPMWEIYPRHILFTLSGYKGVDNNHKPQVWVYPVAEYEKINPDSTHIIDSLKDLLKTKPAAAPNNRMPFLPMWNAAQAMSVQIKYLDFQNGSGVRYITQYQQGPLPISNREVFYTYQGLTKDGKYYIAMVMPVSHQLIINPDLAMKDPLFQKDFPAYLATVVKTLNAAPANTFLPDLDLLDKTAQSVSIR
jgi:hypothetical protein